MLILGLKGFRSVKLLSLKVIKLTDLCRVGTVSVRVKFRDWTGNIFALFLRITFKLGKLPYFKALFSAVSMGIIFAYCSSSKAQRNRLWIYYLH